MAALEKDSKKNICWITPDYFLDTDIHIVPELSKIYDIDWVLIIPFNSKRGSDGLSFKGFTPREIRLKYRQKDPRIILQYIKFLSEIRHSNYDMIYNSFHGVPFFLPILFSFIKPGKLIYGSHNFTTPKGASHEKVMRLYHNYVYRRIQNIHVFSEFQLELVKKALPTKNIYYSPFALKDHGYSDVIPPNDVIRFLFFGYIRKYKRLDLLLEAFQNLYNSGIHNIELVIAGSCENWEQYQAMINIENAVQTRIEVIPNSEIPDIISSCHYMVLPYQDSAQSGILSTSYQYNKPVIASNIKAFDNLVIDGETGYYFENQSLENLTMVMKNAVLKHNSSYEKLKENITELIKSKFELDVILAKYHVMLDECINRAITNN